MYRGNAYVQTAIDRCRKIVQLGLSAEQCYQLAENYYSQGDQISLQEAFNLYHIAAAQDHTDAQYCLGYCYEYAEGTNYDYAQAIEWYRKAAEKGQAGAQEGLEACLVKFEQQTSENLYE